jgi:hypothetical protein
MSEQEKKYVPKSSVKRVVTPKGTEIIKLGLHASTVAEFIRTNANAKGYVNLCITARREVSQYGDTHCLWLDTWEPKRAEGEQAQSGFANMRKAAGAPQTNAKIDKDDVPF